MAHLQFSLKLSRHKVRCFLALINIIVGDKQFREFFARLIFLRHIMNSPEVEECTAFIQISYLRTIVVRKQKTALSVYKCVVQAQMILPCEATVINILA